MFFVLEGALEVLIGDEITVLEAGDLLVVPPGTTHAFAAAPDRTADVLFVFAPGRDGSSTTGCWTACIAARAHGTSSVRRRSASTTTTPRAPPGRRRVWG